MSPIGHRYARKIISEGPSSEVTFDKEVTSWREGDGSIATDSETLPNLAFSFASRFAGAPGGNPEERFAAAYAGCLSQALANTLDRHDYTIERSDIRVEVELDMESVKPEFKGVHMILKAKVPRIAGTEFQDLAAKAKAGCLISRLLKIEATMEASLEGERT